jgi:hypothetical protein
VTLQIDNVGFVYIDGVRVARYIPTRHALQFWDKDRRRSSKRGGNRHVEIDVCQLIEELNEAEIPPLRKHSQGSGGER